MKISRRKFFGFLASIPAAIAVAPTVVRYWGGRAVPLYHHKRLFFSVSTPQYIESAFGKLLYLSHKRAEATMKRQLETQMWPEWGDPEPTAGGGLRELIRDG